MKANGKGSAEALIATGTMSPTPGGLAIVIHAKRDDEKTDPSGDSGDRIACGAVFRAGGFPALRGRKDAAATRPPHPATRLFSD